MKFLQLELKGPLQSWGERGRWDSRDTAAMPTKSGMIGLLGCCLGYTRGAKELTELDEKLHFAVRADRAGRIMIDFQTVQSEAGKNFPTAAGGTRSGNTIITPKQYLQDAQFTALLWGDESLLMRCRDALLHPHWVPYLGRRSCIPSAPLIPILIEAENVDEAIRLNLQADAAAEIELLPGGNLREDEHAVRRLDGIQDASRNEYKHRIVRASWLKKKEDASCI